MCALRVADLANLTEAERRDQFSKLLSPPAGGVYPAEVGMRSRIRSYEARYEMTSAELLKKLEAGEIRETAEVSEWLFLLSALPNGVRR